MIQPAPSASSSAGAPGQPREHALLRLDAYSRYAEILAAQLDALEDAEPDLDRFHSLTLARAAVAQEIDAAGPLAVDSPEIQDLVHRIRDQIHECRRTDAAVLERLGQLKQDTARALHTLDGRKNARAGYQVAGPGDGARLDVKL